MWKEDKRAAEAVNEGGDAGRMKKKGERRQRCEVVDRTRGRRLKRRNGEGRGEGGGGEWRTREEKLVSSARD